MFEVLENDHGIRPAGKPDQCFYCPAKLGEPHGQECVVIVHDVVFAAHLDGNLVGTYTHALCSGWDMDACGFWANEGTWCSDNIADHLNQLEVTTEARAAIVELIDSAKPSTCSGLCMRLHLEPLGTEGEARRAV